MSSTTKNTDAAAGNNANTSPPIAENTSPKYLPDESSDSDDKCDETIQPGASLKDAAPISCKNYNELTDYPDWENAGDDDVEASDEVTVEGGNANGGDAAADSLQAGQGDAGNVSANANTGENANMSINTIISGNGNVTSTKRTNATCNCTKRKRGKSLVDTLLEEYLKKEIKRHDDKEKARNESATDYNAQKVRLAEQFQAMTSALNGDRLRAAKVCPDFEILLSTGEKVELAML
mmetsp:Transcript_9033/g.16012  ORF Transcript_9033/g.16012 Transcript_9033/m.16012 type:complete len:236 (-) Transcript_9033:65-772(-)